MAVLLVTHQRKLEAADVYDSVNATHGLTGAADTTWILESLGGAAKGGAVLCGVGLCLGYALLGACWLVKKGEGDLRDAAYRLIPYLSVGLLAFLIIVFGYALAENLRVIHRWLERPYLLVFPAIGIVAALVAAASVRHRRDGVPFYMVALIFAAAFGTLAISFWPYMIPFAITIDEAAAPHSSLAFMFWGAGIFVFPLMLLYTAVSYTVFRGKVRPTADHY